MLTGLCQEASDSPCTGLGGCAGGCCAGDFSKRLHGVKTKLVSRI